MKLQIASDLHLDTHNDRGSAFLEAFGNDEGADTLIVAGDLCEVRNTEVLDRALTCFSLQWKNVVVVAGNHELWGSNFVKGMELLKTYAHRHRNVRVLDNASIKLDDIRIFGGTAWYRAPQTPIDKDIWKDFSDSRAVQGINPKAFESRAAFEAGMYGDQAGGYDVIVSHHLPSALCVAPKWQGHPSNRFFVADLDVQNCGASLWVHGHTHNQVDIQIGQTKVLANPLGYPSEASNFTFVSNYIVEI